MRTREYRYYNNEKQILLSIHYQNNFDHLLIVWLSGYFVVCMAQKKPTNTATAPTAFTVGYQQTAGKAGLSSQGKRHKKNGVTITGSFVSQY